MWNGLGQDIRLALRGLFATRIVSAVAVLSLALGIGASTAIFSLINSLLLRRLPVEHPERLVTVASDFTINLGFKAGAGWNYEMWTRFQRHAHLFDGALAWAGPRMMLGSGGETQAVNGLYASGSFFTTLGVKALHGRVFTAEDDVRGGGAVAVLGYGLWQRRFGGKPEVVGTPLVVEGVPVTIVGITPPGFLGVEIGQAYDVALPINAEPLIRGKYTSLLDPRAYLLIPMLRLKPGQSVRAGTEAIRAVQAEIVPAQGPRFTKEPFTLALAAEGTSNPSGGASGLRQRYQQPLVIILGVVSLVLVIACVNIANLLLARGVARRHELSVRVALGASRWRLGRQLLTEALVLALLGGVAGALFASWGSRMLVTQVSSSVSQVVLDLSPDWRVALFTAGISVATALLFGVAPAFRAMRIAPHDVLIAYGPAAGRGSARSRFSLSNALVVLQVALSLVLVVGAGLLVRTFERLASLPLGFDRDRVLVVNVDTTRAQVDAAGRFRLYQRLVEAASTASGVELAAGSLWTPLSGSGALMGVTIAGAPQGAERGVVANFVTPGWFGAYGIRLVAGRDIGAGDTSGSPPVLVVNEAFVRRFFPGGGAIGGAVGHSDRADSSRTSTIVGVVRDAAFRTGRMIPGAASLALREPVPPMIYVPLEQSGGMGPAGSTGFAISVRAGTGSPAALSRNVAAALTAVDPNLAVTFRPLDDFVHAALGQERLVALLSGFFGALALLLAGLGLYGLTSYAVNLRRIEIGIRLALGAQRRGVVRLVLTRVAVLVGLGVVTGAVASVWASRFVATLLYGLAPGDPSTLAGAAVVLAAVGAAAGCVPAWRASRTDPATVLRAQ